jgi:hypothetical protein
MILERIRKHWRFLENRPAERPPSARREGPVPVRDFAEKLKLTAVLLGCATQKDLCLMFRRVNPDTEFDLERSYNWVQGRSRPRSATVYEDWATLLGTDRPSGFLTSCSMDEFLDVVARRFDLSRTELAHMAGDPAAEAERAPPANAPPAYLAGFYACYSHAWSPHFRGMIVRGSLSITSAATPEAPSLSALYGESVAVGRLQLRGPVHLAGRSLSIDLAGTEEQLRLHMTLFPPSPPASVLAGVMSGTTFVDFSARPAATRIVMVRVPETSAGAVERSDRYVDIAEEPLSRDLAALGIPLGNADAAEIDRLLDAFLSADDEPRSHLEAPAAAYAELTLAVDRLMLPMLQPEAPIPRRLGERSA